MLPNVESMGSYCPTKYRNMKINMEEVKAAQKFMNEWCEQNGTKIMLTPDSALEIMQCMADYKGQSLPIDSVVGSYDHCNIVDLTSNKTILTTPANRFEVKFIDADKEVGKIKI